MKKLIKQIIKFGTVGVIAFFTDWGLLAFSYEMLYLKLVPFGNVISATIGFTVSVIFNYIASMKYVFKHKKGLDRRDEFMIFVVLSVVGLGINNGLIWVGSTLMGIHPAIAKIPFTAIVMVWNFVTRKIFLDNAKNKKCLT
ncbi:MAG: GtrA family protein [Eggerthellaceae bacterium]|nr:GtrA family protein [Eggerthellaceae bacterium]